MYHHNSLYPLHLQEIYDALDNYEKHLDNQWFFRNKCECEPMKWEWETSQLFGALYKTIE